jgi:hypothetical protein
MTALAIAYGLGFATPLFVIWVAAKHAKRAARGRRN